MADAKLGARALVLILAVVCGGWPAMGAQPAAPVQSGPPVQTVAPPATPTTAGGRQTALDFQHNVVRIITKTADGQDGPAGFGIVIGERDGRLYIATPDHVARGSDDLTATPDVIFFAEQGRRYPARRLEELRIPPAQGDLAVLELARPSSFRPARITIIDPGEVPDAAPIWNVGRTERWLVPTSPGGFQGIDVQTNHLMVEDLPTPPGSSGGAVLTDRALLGMTLRDSGAQRITYVFRGDRLVEVFQRWQLPVNLVQRNVASAPAPPVTIAPTPPRVPTPPPVTIAPTTPRVPTPQQQPASPVRPPAATQTARAGAECDRLAAHPNDPQKPAGLAGASSEQLRATMADAERACDAAHKQAPAVARYGFQLARALVAQHRAAEAIEPARAAGEAGSVMAQSMLGVMYRNGLGVPVDHQKAVPWLERAARGGDTIAQYFLAKSYAEGKGVTRDDAQAVHWLQQPAERNYAPAQTMLGQMHERGLGTSVDYTQARQWYEKASSQGDQEGKAALARLYRSPGQQFLRPSQR